MSEPPAFTTRRSLAPIHWALTGPDPDGPVTRRIAWLAPEGARPDATVSLATAWRIGGPVVFLGRPVRSDPAFLDALRRWVAGASSAARLVWLVDPTAPLGSWSPAVLEVGGASPAGGTVTAPARIGGGGYEVAVERGCTVTLTDDPPAFSLGAESGGAAEGVTLHAPGGGPLPLAGPVTLALRGAAAGGLGVRPASPAGGGGRLLDTLDAGLRYAWPGAGASPGSVRYPVFDPGEAPLTLEGLLDPNDPGSERAGFHFGDDPPTLPSHFRTDRGMPVRLTPQDGAALRFSPAGRAGTLPGALTLVPAGPFAATAPGRWRLLCGTSGVETVDPAGGSLILRFDPGRPAWAPAFVPGGSHPATGSVAARLTDAATTSWIAVEGAGPLRYLAQPRDAVLHTAAADGLLDPFQVTAAELSAAGEAGEVPAVVPMAPYGGVAPSDRGPAALLEVEVLARERRDRIVAAGTEPGRRAAARTPPDAPTEPVTAVTPSGWVASFDADRETWRSLVLARVGGRELVLQDIEGPLRAALLTSGQFLVISDPEAVAPHLRDHAVLELDGWGFDLTPTGWARHGTMLLLKSCPRSLAELAADPDAWVLPDAFNASPAVARDELTGWIAEARERAAQEAEPGADPEATPWRRFVTEVVDDPAWNGWLAVRCPVPPSALPGELRDLAAGLDEDSFFAHHMGLRQTPVGDLGETPGDSALFAAVTYEDASPPPADRDHAFQVTALTAVFESSALRSFAARVALTLRRILGAPARLPSGPPTLVLDAALQRRGDHDIYVFRTTREATFLLDDRVLASLLVTRCELGAGDEEPGAGAGGGAGAEEVVARFVFRGALGFHALPGRRGTPVDLFGYDALSFSGLVLEMRFPEDDPGAVRFRLATSSVAFDGDAASARPGSLAARFPLRPRSLLSGDPGTRPDDLGWSVLAVPALDAAAPTGAWLALAFDLDLGTPGALADVAGLTAGLALVWSPSHGTVAFQAGLRLPGAGDADGVDLMGMLDLDVYQQRLRVVDDGYLLELTGITLRFLGKALPGDGTFSMLLFGDPQGSGSLGWYGAYRRTADADGAGGPLLAGGAPSRARRLSPGRSARRPGGIDDQGDDDAPSPAWHDRPWAWTLIERTEDG